MNILKNKPLAFFLGNYLIFGILALVFLINVVTFFGLMQAVSPSQPGNGAYYAGPIIPFIVMILMVNFIFKGWRVVLIVFIVILSLDFLFNLIIFAGVFNGLSSVLHLEELCKKITDVPLDYCTKLPASYYGMLVGVFFVLFQLIGIVIAIVAVVKLKREDITNVEKV